MGGLARYFDVLTSATDILVFFTTPSFGDGHRSAM
jgi:hypothetical protein